MAGLQIEQPSGPGLELGVVWGVTVLILMIGVILMGIIAWFAFRRGQHRTSQTTIDIDVPKAGAPASDSDFAQSRWAPPSGGATPSNPGGRAASSTPATKTR